MLWNHCSANEEVQTYWWWCLIYATYLSDTFITDNPDTLPELKRFVWIAFQRHLANIVTKRCFSTSKKLLCIGNSIETLIVQPSRKSLWCSPITICLYQEPLAEKSIWVQFHPSWKRFIWSLKQCMTWGCCKCFIRAQCSQKEHNEHSST